MSGSWTPWRHLLLAGGLAGLLLPPAALGWHLLLDRRALPDLARFERFELPVTGQIRDAHGLPLAELAREHRRLVASAEIPPVVRAAVLAAEDNRFLTHPGVDLRALPRVALRTLLHGLHGGALSHEPFVQGGSSITQQLVRGWFLRDQVRAEREPVLSGPGSGPRLLASLVGVRAANKLLRKLEEVRLALWLERELQARTGSGAQAKEEILVRYANLVYLGEGRYGLGDAARHWFGRELESLGSDDAPLAALLAARIRRPEETDPAALLRRRNQVLARMAANGALAAAELPRLQQRPLLPELAAEQLPSVPGVVRGVLGELRVRGVGLDELLDGRVGIRTTVDARVQRLASAALEGGIQAYSLRHPEAAGAIQGAVVVLANDTAAVLAEVGGRPDGPDGSGRRTDFDRATEALRQPGSVMKPFVYLAALRRGFLLDAPLMDSPIAVPMGRGQPLKWIGNYDGKFQGRIPLRRALAQSRNAATVWLARRIGMRAVLRTARELGVETELAIYPSTALGASEVTLLELANAYRAMASGVGARPHFLLEVAGEAGAPFPAANAPIPPLAVDGPALALIQEGLRGVVRLPGGTARALDAPAFPIPVMGKTGTSSEFRDALFVGSTFGPEGITVAVWLGFDDSAPLGARESGAKAALPVFRELVGRIYALGLVGPAPQFPSAVEQGIDAFLARPPPELPPPAAPLPAAPAVAEPAVAGPARPAPAVPVLAALIVPG